MPPLKQASGFRLQAAGLKLPIWRGPAELEATPEACRELGPEAPDEVSRRGILQLLGGSAAMATLGGCLKPPDEKILPYTKQPPEVTPGNPLHYATCSTLDGHATGLLVTASEGRPTRRFSGWRRRKPSRRPRNAPAPGRPKAASGEGMTGERSNRLRLPPAEPPGTPFIPELPQVRSRAQALASPAPSEHAELKREQQQGWR